MNTYEGPLIPYAKDQLHAIFYFGDIYHYIQRGGRFGPSLRLECVESWLRTEG